MQASVLHHPKPASQSNKIRGAALSQLMKVQNILSSAIPPTDLYDENDVAEMYAADLLSSNQVFADWSAYKERMKELGNPNFIGKEENPHRLKYAKLSLYVKATAIVRTSLQVILNSWMQTGFSSKVALANEPGGYDLLIYCTKHIIHAYNNKTAMTKALGNPWERIMMSQGPTPMIVDLFLKICNQENNLIAVNRIGGHKALHNLSRYADSTEVRQQATMYLTKLAVLLSEKTAGVNDAANKEDSTLAQSQGA